ncbi:MAG TPA: 50S ribosomal protein L34e [archaeon]|jgi:large subunit ribosomal protein L34e|nr:50S ribosomal protein L34e [archaeon]HPC10091.1 50S ribosomal protein L34e [archaeon]HRT02336.1 50S ribosomal protein L34e [Candidatus Diapherotrites archaeon]
MPKPKDRFDKHKMVKTPGGKQVRKVKLKKPGKHKCAISGKILQGVPHGLRPHEVHNLKKSERRPGNPLASMIEPKTRKEIYLEAVMLKYNIISQQDIDLSHKKYIDMILKKIE